MLSLNRPQPPPYIGAKLNRQRRAVRLLLGRPCRTKAAHFRLLPRIAMTDFAAARRNMVDGQVRDRKSVV
jgi:hypothetical protein